MDTETMTTLLDTFAQLVADKLAARLESGRQCGGYYTPEELAKRYGVTPDAIRKRIRAGEFGQTVNLGNRCHRVTQEGVQQFDRRHTGAAAAPNSTTQGRRKTRHHADPGRI